MSKLKGSIKKIKDLLLLIDLAKSGKITLKIPFFDKNLNLCIKNDKIYILNNLEGERPERFFQMFIEEWLHSSLDLFFENNPNELCPDDEKYQYLTKKKLKEILSNPLIEEVKKVPKQFEIIEINSENIPTFLKFYYVLKKPLTVRILYSNNLTLIDFIKLLKSESIKIEPVSKIESFPRFLSISLSLILLILIMLYMLPINYVKFNVLYLNRIENIVLRNKILSKKIQPINGCMKAKYILNGNEISIILKYKGIIEKKLAGKKLPDKDYIPIFAIPER